MKRRGRISFANRVMFTPGKRTVSAVLRVMGKTGAKNFVTGDDHWLSRVPLKNSVSVKEFLKSVLALFVVFAIVESLLRVTYFIRNSTVDYIPLPYMMGGDYGPSPPWLDSRVIKLVKPDEMLVWRGQPNIRRKYIDVFSPVHTEGELRSLRHQFLPNSTASLRGNPEWEISTNSEGFRDVEFPKKKSSSVFRIICLGDSWTFGANVGQDEAYPQRLRALLEQEFPAANFEVFNLGVLGYASYSGLKLLKTRALNLEPDIVMIAFAMNEPNMAGYHEKDVPANEEPIALTKRMDHVVVNIGSFISDNIELYRLLRYWALLINWKPKSIGEHLEGESHKLELFEKELDYENLDPWIRVSLEDYEKNLLEMINLARSKDAGIVLLYNEFWRESPYRRVLEKISRAEGVPWVDSSSVLSAAQSRIEEKLEEKLKLQPSDDEPIQLQGGTEVIFRVYLGARSVPKAIYIVGAHEKLGNLVPNKIAMYDCSMSTIF